MKIQKGDKVKAMKGKDSGKTGSVVKVLKPRNKVIVEGINMLNKHQKPKKEGEKGVKIQFASPISVSNVMVICPKCGKETRVGFVIGENKKKMRQCKKCKATF
ncbi:50S ribosomal protein L24 [Candidatus Parcubacteria bacterium]|nr:50S ribosomal protein L24 [Candidatus Parcubacteria bacterium]